MIAGAETEHDAQALARRLRDGAPEPTIVEVEVNRAEGLGTDPPVRVPGELAG